VYYPAKFTLSFFSKANLITPPTLFESEEIPMASILIVDDQRSMRNMFKGIFKGSGHDIEYAEDGQVAYKAATMSTYNLILADLIMPKMDGIDLTRKLRKLTKYEDTPIFIVSSAAKDDNKQKAKDAGANGWITKPISAEKVHKLVGQTLGHM